MALDPTAVKATVSGRDADKILYMYKRIEKEPQKNPMHMLGLQGATSITNTRTLQSTATKGANIKGVGSATQQWVTEIVMSDPKGQPYDLFLDLYAAWQNGELIGLWRLDFNTVRGVKPHRKVQAAFAQAYIPNLPGTEALGASQSIQATWEINGLARWLDEDENPYWLSEDDLGSKLFDNVAHFYNFSKGTDLGTDDSGQMVDDTVDDSHTGLSPEDTNHTSTTASSVETDSSSNGSQGGAGQGGVPTSDASKQS